jgi:SAM-dependent methyltransferase
VIAARNIAGMSGSRSFAPGAGGLRRSAALLTAFRVEQTEPDRFYGLLARDSLALIGAHTPLAGKLVLDVGAGPVAFAAEFARAGARYVAVDADVRELTGPRPAGTGALAARGERLPVAAGSVDVCFSSNVVEHVPAPWRFADELVRVTRPGGLVVVSYTNWLSPWGGHECSPWHYLGGYTATERYGRRYGHPPKNQYGIGLFPVSVAAGLGWARRHPGVDLVDARPRYLPGWARPLLRVPGLREIATWNLWLVLRRR